VFNFITFGFILLLTLVFLLIIPKFAKFVLFFMNFKLIQKF